MLHLLWSSLLRIWGWLSHLWILTPNWRHENDYRLLFALKTCTVNLDSSKLTQGSIHGFRDRGNEEINLQLSQATAQAWWILLQTNWEKGTICSCTSRGGRTSEDWRAPRTWRTPTLTFKTGFWFCLRPTQRKGAHSDKLIVTLLWRWCKEFHLWLITN